MAGIFKAYDIRGVFGKDLDADDAYKIGLAIASVIGRKPIAAGHDMRESYKDLFPKLVDGLTDGGADVYDVGLIETPMFNFAAVHLNTNGCVMVTASHNPAQYNGFKLCRKDAIPVSYDTGIAEIERIVKHETVESLKAEKKGNVTEFDIKEAYADHVKSFIKKISPLKIAVDAGNGMAGMTVPLVTKDLPLDIKPLFFKLDGSFPNHEANPLKPENLVDLQKKVLEENADFGVAFDGDADRVMFVDEKGDTISADLTGCLIAMEFLKNNPGEKILYDLRSSKILPEIVKEHGGISKMCRVGHAFIKRQLREENGIFASELSGHYYFRDNFFTDSALIAFFMIVNLVSSEKKPLSSLIKPLKKYYATGEINSRVSDPDSKMNEAEEAYGKGGTAYHLDGLSIDFGDWWFNIRKSNTEPVLRLNLEATSEKNMIHMRDDILKLIRR
ncbi:MAG: phosphomannomutase/phosphoglucomutase [Candidatus Theseobacter exili]|nr:phosphomannomutase/phosphoglucomutase [Candidatus Theseobacter exili]